LDNKQPNNPLHGVKLADIVEYLYNEYGWEKLGQKIKINSFTKDPSIKSSLKFLRKTDWARKEVEDLYLWTMRKNAQRRSRNKPAEPKQKPVKKAEETPIPVKDMVVNKPKVARKFGRKKVD